VGLIPNQPHSFCLELFNNNITVDSWTLTIESEGMKTLVTIASEAEYPLLKASVAISVSYFSLPALFFLDNVKPVAIILWIGR
jgi:hypothetical protein